MCRCGVVCASRLQGWWLAARACWTSPMFAFPHPGTARSPRARVVVRSWSVTSGVEEACSRRPSAVHTTVRGLGFGNVAKHQSKVAVPSLINQARTITAVTLSRTPPRPQCTTTAAARSEVHATARRCCNLDHSADTRVRICGSRRGWTRTVAGHVNSGCHCCGPVAATGSCVAPASQNVATGARAVGCVYSCERRANAAEGAWHGQKRAVPLCLALLIVVVSLVAPLASATVDPAQRQALVDVYNATSGSTWARTTGWASYPNSSNDPCANSWYGVACDAGNQTVMYVDRCPKHSSE